jgi:hypothetical protein
LSVTRLTSLQPDRDILEAGLDSTGETAHISLVHVIEGHIDSIRHSDHRSGERSGSKAAITMKVTARHPINN